MKKVLLLLILAVGLLGLSSCNQVAHPLEGTWTVTSAPTTPGIDRDLGNGTITLNYLSEAFGAEFYTGTAAFDDGRFGPYVYIGRQWTGPAFLASE